MVKSKDKQLSFSTLIGMFLQRRLGEGWKCFGDGVRAQKYFLNHSALLFFGKEV